MHAHDEVCKYQTHTTDCVNDYNCNTMNKLRLDFAFTATIAKLFF